MQTRYPDDPAGGHIEWTVQQWWQDQQQGSHDGELDEGRLGAGMLTAAQGRSYEHTLCAGRSLELSGIARMLWGSGNLGRRFHALPQLALCLRDHGLERLRVCAASGCQRVFVDTSRNRSRRYCNPDICGNRTNVAAFRARQRAAGASG